MRWLRMPFESSSCPAEQISYHSDEDSTQARTYRCITETIKLLAGVTADERIIEPIGIKLLGASYMKKGNSAVQNLQGFDTCVKKSIMLVEEKHPGHLERVVITYEFHKADAPNCDPRRVDGHGMLVVNSRQNAQQICDDFQQALVNFGAISSDEHDRDKSKCFDLMDAPYWFHKWLYYCYSQC